MAFNNHIVRSKMYYQFNKEVSVRGILDYSAVLPNASLTSLGNRKSWNADFLFTWLWHPGTAAYFGYASRKENLDDFGRRIGGGPDRDTGKTIFVKLSYLFRF